MAVAGVGITLKRHKQVKPDLLTLPRFSRQEAVRAVYGAAVAAHLAPFSAAANWPGEHGNAPAASSAQDDLPTFSVEGLASTGDAAHKKSTLVLFVNGRTCECAALKTALESAYAALHSKAAFWAFVDVRVPPAHVDVNIHPTKASVALLFQPELIEAVRSAVEGQLSDGHDVRSFARASPSLAPGAPLLPPLLLLLLLLPLILPFLLAHSSDGRAQHCAPLIAGSIPSGEHEAAKTQSKLAPGTSAPMTQRAKAGGDHKLVRSDHRTRSLTPFLSAAPADRSASKAGPSTSATPTLTGASLSATRSRRCASDIVPVS